MKRLILFSLPTEQIKQEIVPLMFLQEIQRKVFAYTPGELQSSFDELVGMLDGPFEANHDDIYLS